MDALALRQTIKATLTPLSLWSPAAEELLMATAAQESLLGRYRTQGGGGPALGIFQMEPNTFHDICVNYLAYHPVLDAKIKALTPGSRADVSDLINNDPFAVAMARVHYLRVPHPMPNENDLAALWHYYKVYYNSVLGAATQDEFYRHYQLTGGTAR